MGTLKEKLDYLDGTKTAIKEALVSKGVEVTEADTFRSYADKITNIPAGGGGDPFSELGYNTPKLILDGIDYGKQILVNYNPDESWDNKWVNDKQLMFFPNVGVYNGSSMYYAFQNSNLQYCPKLDSHNVTNMIFMFHSCEALVEICGFTDTSKVTNMSYMFGGCESLTSVPAMNTSSVTNMNWMFGGCGLLRSVPAMDTSSVTDMGNVFRSCESLTSVPAMNTSKVTNMSFMFGYCKSLIKINGELNILAATNIDTFTFTSCSKLQYMKLTNLGTPQSITSYNFSLCSKWGDETPSTEHPEIDVTGSKQAMIDSLLTNSFDRAAAGYSVCTIKLKSDVKARLTQEQIDAIQAKGYTLTFA